MSIISYINQEKLIENIKNLINQRNIRDDSEHFNNGLLIGIESTLNAIEDVIKNKYMYLIEHKKE